MNSIEQLHNEKKAIQKKLEELQKQLEELNKKEQVWKRFPPEEEQWLREELIMLHTSLLGKHTLFASVYLKHEEPIENTAYGYRDKKHPKSFSIHIELAPVMEDRCGLSVYITIRTKIAEAEKLVREMYRQRPTHSDWHLEEPDDSKRREWEIDYEEGSVIDLPPPPPPPYMKN